MNSKDRLFHTSMSTNTSAQGPSHRDLLVQAKQQQKQDLLDSAKASDNLVRTVNAIVRANSVANSPNCPSLLDKSTTIHEIDAEIDRQLKRDISANYEQLIQAKEKLSKELKRSKGALKYGKEEGTSLVEILQRKAETLDQELRVLEHSLRLIQSRNGD